MPVSTNAILIATDIVSDAVLVKKLLSEEFRHIVVSTDPDKVAGDFVRYQPDVLVLAFKELEKSERYSLNLYRLCPEMHRRPHRTVILCNKDEVTRAYELCMKDHYDDYILFWPMTYDKPRLAMSVHHMLRELAALKGDAPSAAEFAVQARHLAEQEKMLARQVAQGGRHIEVSSRAMEQVEQGIGTALDGFFQRLVSDSLQGSVTVKNVDDLKKEISRFKREEVQQYFLTAAKTAKPLKLWAHEFKQECEPLIESARALTAMAGRILPVVLVVDDDEFQRKLIGQILEAENYHLVFAASGIEALNVMRKVRPDIILMDVMMPDMDGIEATQLLKAAPPLASIPVIMITGQSEGKVVLDSRKAGAIDFVVKPLDRATLLVKIAGVLNASTTLLLHEPAHLEG
ncbi:MAG: response regulator [Gallionella sp.]|nr:response regulator [Gallionella sp.]